MEGFEILYVDDDREILSIVNTYLSRQGYKVVTVDNGFDALELIKEKKFNIVFTDYKMPDFDGIELLAAIKELRSETEVIIVTGHGTMESAIQAMHYGSYDFIQKPFKLNTLKILVDRIMQEQKLLKENILLRKRLGEKIRCRFDELVGINYKMQELFETLEKICTGNGPILIEGEMGTGKKLIASIIHKKSLRSDKSFIVVNTESLEKELQKTDPSIRLTALIEDSRGGTVFLDDVAALSLNNQNSLLKVMTENRSDPESGNGKPGSVPRIIGALLIEAREALKTGFLSRDFYIYLNKSCIKVPPLRDRKEDVILLLNHFIYRACTGKQKMIAGISPETMDILVRYHWPGNIIQLENVVERSMALGAGGPIEADHLPLEIRTFVAGLK